MTQTIALNGTTPEINPLYIKLRRRFACPGDRTIGEMKAMEAIRDGYQPYAASPRVSSVAQVSESHVTMANSLPHHTASHEYVAPRTRTSGTAVLLLILAAVLVLFLALSGAQIGNLNRELSGLQNSALYLGDSLTMTPRDVYENNAEAVAQSEGGEIDPLQNVLHAFSEN